MFRGMWLLEGCVDAWVCGCGTDLQSLRGIGQHSGQWMTFGHVLLKQVPLASSLDDLKGKSNIGR